MLITFSDSGRIARNNHEFYEDAFIALWSKHDSRKDGFERDRYSSLGKTEFLRLLAAFAISSYHRGDYDMRSSQFQRHFEAATRLSGISCAEEGFYRDLTVSMSLAVEDGPFIRFCHRSFQEYFSAIFICELNDTRTGQLIEEVSDRMETDNVLPMVLSINTEKNERTWVIPKMQTISETIGAVGIDVGQYARYAIAPAGSADNVSDTMHKMRILYQFEPNTAALRSAMDAAAHMRISVGTLTRRSPAKGGGIFERDRSNFLRLIAYLEKRYKHRSSALVELLGYPEEPEEHARAIASSQQLIEDRRGDPSA